MFYVCLIIFAIKSAKNAAHLQLYHTEKCFAEDAGVHLACAKHSVYEDDWHFLYLEA